MSEQPLETYEPSLGRFVLAGYTWRSWVALGLLVSVGSLVGYSWSDLVDANGVDRLLLGTWLWMALMLCWRVSLGWDLLLVVTGFCGGAVIEWWGTTTQLWTYFTAERPPLWILPAWPIAAISIDRMAVFYGEALRRLEGLASPLPNKFFNISYWIAVPLFVAFMTRFLWPAIHKPASWVVVGIMLAVLFSSKNKRADILIFAAGSSLGIFLEYWGTSRECWTYYTGQVPPPIAVFAHGFAALAFNRAGLLAARAFKVKTPAHSQFGKAVSSSAFANTA